MCGVWPLGLGPRWETHPGLFCLPARVGGVGGGVVLAWGTAACGCLVGAAACGRGPCGVCVGGVLVLVAAGVVVGGLGVACCRVLGRHAVHLASCVWGVVCCWSGCCLRLFACWGGVWVVVWAGWL